ACGWLGAADFIRFNTPTSILNCIPRKQNGKTFRLRGYHLDITAYSHPGFRVKWTRKSKLFVFLRDLGDIS
ncbi:MAG TPA: hypothetical protein PKX41_11340, partial [Anaerolineaceae bacterium]|nr:hypothetical protein [Anaerolineaceae bacterium]